MTRKHFQEIANEIKHLECDDDTRAQFALAMIRVCSKFNANFKQAQFLDACGVAEVK